MNFDGLQKLHMQQVSLWPPPRVEPEGRITPMTWRVEVNRTARTVELHASSGHFFDATDVIHNYQRYGKKLVLRAQVSIIGDVVDVQPLMGGVAGRQLSPRQRHALTRRLQTIARPTQPVYLMGLQGNVESIELAKSLKPIFEDAGWVVDGVWEDNLIGGTGPGILVRQATADGPVGVGLKDALLDAGLESRIIPLGSSRAQDKVEVIIGYQPQSPG